MFFPIAFDFGEIHSVIVTSIVGMYVTLSYMYTVQRMLQLAINTIVCIYTSMTFSTFFEIQLSHLKTFNASFDEE